MNHRVQGSLEESVVKKIFPSAISLLDYVELITGTKDRADTVQIHPLLREGDSEEFISFITANVLVVPEEESLVRVEKYIPPTVPHPPLREMINRIVAKQVRKNCPFDFTKVNCLSLGYKLASEHNNTFFSMRSTPDVDSVHLNTMHILIISSPLWQKVAQRLGEGYLTTIFARPCFVRVANGCFAQVSGTAASELIHSSTRVGKNTALSHSIGNNANNAGKPPSNASRAVASEVITGSTAFSRHAIFYNSMYVKHPGLPNRHVLKVIEFTNFHITRTNLFMITKFYS